MKSWCCLTCLAVIIMLNTCVGKGISNEYKQCGIFILKQRGEKENERRKKYDPLNQVAVNYFPVMNYRPPKKSRQTHKQKQKQKLKRMAFLISHMHLLNKRGKTKVFRIFRGCGTTENYEWVERDDHLEIKVRLSENVKKGDIQYCLKSDYIFLKLKDREGCILKGKLKGIADTFFSTWFLEKMDGCNVLNIFLKKKHKGINEWVGVVENESIIHLSYDESSTNYKEYNTSSLKTCKENELLFSYLFDNAKFDDVYSFLLNWASKKTTSGNDFGIPLTKLKTNVMQNDYTIEILISGFDRNWKAEDSLVLKLSSVKEGTMLHVFRGKVASGILGIYGNVISMLVKDCEERILKKLQHDIKGVFYLNPLYKKMEKAMRTQNPQPHYHIVAEDKEKGTQEKDSHKELDKASEKLKSNEKTQTEEKKKQKEEGPRQAQRPEQEQEQEQGVSKEVRKDSSEEALIVKELNLESKVELSCSDKKKEPEFMKNWSEEKKIEFRRNSVLELKKSLELTQEKKINAKLEDYVKYMKIVFDLSDEESQLIWKKGFKKTQEQKKREEFVAFIELEQLTNRIKAYGFEKEEEQEKERNKGLDSHSKHMRDKGVHNENYLTYKINRNINAQNVNSHFLNVLDDDLSYPAEEKTETLYELYTRSNTKEKKEMREKWKVNEMRLHTLIEELRYINDDDNNMIPVICNNYREVLLSEEYACLMTIYLLEHPPKTIEEKNILQKINFFVISLYDDIKIVMEHEEKEHLKKIRLICQKAIEDENGLNEYIESMKPLLDYSFLAYIKHAIEIEKKNLLLQKKDFREQPSDWLVILIIIKRGIYSILEKDIWEDVLHISTIICHEQPTVRKTLLQTMVASMPKADWIFFKDLIKTLYKSVLEKKLTVNHFAHFPHIIEAIFQLHFDIEQILPDWFIKEMLDDYDKSVIEQIKQKKPLFWKMKETQWDKKFVAEFKQKQIEKFQEYANSKALSNINNPSV